MRSVLLTLALLSAAAQHAPAQGLPDSARVRITATGLSPHRPVVGTVLAVRPGLIVIQEERKGGSVLEIPTDIISKLEMSRGNASAESAAWRGMWQGTLAGAVMVGGSSLVYGMGNDNGGDSRPAIEVAARGAAVGAVVGFLAGSVAGSRARERWEPVRVSASGAPRKTASVSLSLAF